ncbi:MAG: tetratricopeptide repeat protein, partial [Desulfobacterales bacterium]|nr:tetratricopeptide repeat protein [Desulfobacterales bacterium]
MPIKSKIICCEPSYFQIALRTFAVLYLLLIIMAKSTGASETIAMHEIIKKAEALIFKGNAEEAYELLAPLESELAGSVDFDYLFGVAALDSGNPAKATLAFERVLLRKPNFAGARLDMGRAYFAMGNYIMAQKEFQKVLGLNPPPFARKIVL